MLCSGSDQIAVVVCIYGHRKKRKSSMGQNVFRHSFDWRRTGARGMPQETIIRWLLEGDVSIQYQTYRDLLNLKKPELQDRISQEGWGKTILGKWNSRGRLGWGEDFYQPKWTSTHYTLLDLRNLNLSCEEEVPKKTIEFILSEGKSNDGGIPLGPSTVVHSDVCVNAMFLNYASYFQCSQKDLKSIVDSILQEIMPDGGFNCRSTRSGARHSSMHSTISVLEGFYEYQKANYDYRLDDINNAMVTAQEFLLMHRLYKSDRTGEIIHKDFLKLAYPSRWKYDILRCLDYFQYSGQPWDERMSDAVESLLAKRNSDGSWNMQAAHPGKQHVTMERAGQPGRWNTLRALRVLKHFGIFSD